MIVDLRAECGFRRKRTLYLAGDKYGARALKAEVEARADAGVAAELLSAARLRAHFGIDRTAAIESGISASASPAQLTAGFISTCP